MKAVKGHKDCDHGKTLTLTLIVGQIHVRIKSVPRPLIQNALIYLPYGTLVSCSSEKGKT